jgi:hypothetical protein
MYMSFQTLLRIFISRGGGGGDNGAATGIAHNSMITDGRIIAIILFGTEIYPMIGDIVTATIFGVVGLGILPISITAILIIIGVVVSGVMIMGGAVLAVDVVVGMDTM